MTERGHLPELPCSITLEEELPKGHPDKLPKAFIGKEGMLPAKGFNNNIRKKVT